jgi:hypothetical protein
LSFGLAGFGLEEGEKLDELLLALFELFLFEFELFSTEVNEDFDGLVKFGL